MKRLNESGKLRGDNLVVPEVNTPGLLDLDSSILDESWKRNWQVNRLVLLVKEPTTLFVYWEVDDSRKQLISDHFQCVWAELPFFLQVYDVTDLEFNGYNANFSFRIPVRPLSDHWVITGVQAERRYIVDFGTTTLTGGFFTIIRSNIEATPPPHSGRKLEPYLRLATWPKPDNNQTGITKKKIVRSPRIEDSWLRQFDGYTFVHSEGGQKG
ncbi:MAG: DUF4912 domain-containing protein [Desulfotomaculaceae bacterium]|nr:DUF4912 domain-containing protein [Desulfotomaculaceae bacterium]